MLPSPCTCTTLNRSRPLRCDPEPAIPSVEVGVLLFQAHELVGKLILLPLPPSLPLPPRLLATILARIPRGGVSARLQWGLPRVRSPSNGRGLAKRVSWKFGNLVAIQYFEHLPSCIDKVCMMPLGKQGGYREYLTRPRSSQSSKDGRLRQPAGDTGLPRPRSSQKVAKRL